jgi:hypothetical protein
MLYLKNALSGLGRHLHDSVLHAFQGPHRWWKLAFFAAMFVLPGGSVLIALAAWFDHRRHLRGEPASASASASAQSGEESGTARTTTATPCPRLPKPAPLAATSLCSAAQRSLQATLGRPSVDAARAQAALRS